MDFDAIYAGRRAGTVISPDEAMMMGSAIDKMFPSRKTTLFVSMVILSLSAAFVWMDKIGSSEWVTIALAVLAIYSGKTVMSEKTAATAASQERQDRRES